MQTLKLAQKYAAIIVVVVAVAILAALAGAGRGPLINEMFGYVVAAMKSVLYFKIPLPFLREMPLVVAVLFLGAVYFTFRFRFINFRGFKHSIDVIRGRYDNPDDPGDVSHFQALSSALSATVGLGNIAGVAIAVSLGGPGAVFWMMVVALFGMTSKFAECTLGQMYRQTDTAGEMRGGPMVYLREGLADRSIGNVSLKKFGIFLSVLFAILCIGTSLGAGNMFQTNQSFNALSDRLQWLGGYPAEGEVTLRSERKLELDQPPHLMHFAVRPTAEDDDEGASLGFRPPAETSVEKQSWSSSDDKHQTTFTFQSDETQTAGVLKLYSNKGGLAGTLDELLASVRAPDADEFVALSSASIDREEWERVETDDPTPTAWSEATDRKMENTTWNDHAQTWRVLLNARTADGAELELELNVPERVTIDDLRAAIGDVAPPLADLAGSDLLAFKPASPLELEESDWRSADGGFEVDLPVEARGSGERYNVRSETVTTVLDARLGPDRRTIEDWLVVPDIQSDNAEAMAGGVNNRGWIYGLVLLILVGLVIIGGIKSIARVAEKIVPAMCVFYILAGLIVIYLNIDRFGLAVTTIFQEAFNLQAGWGVFVGIFVQGVRRAAFSSEAGIGSAPIAHSAAKTDEPVREGIVAMLGPFIDTIIVCFITGMVIVITGVWAAPSTAGLAGVTLTVEAFKSASHFFAWALSIAVVLFAFSTMLSWSYYGERCWTYLFGDDQAMAFRFIFLFFVLLGSVSTLGNVLSFGDYFLLAMAFPNILGVVLLSDEIDEQLKDYWARYTGDDMPTYDEKMKDKS